MKKTIMIIMMSGILAQAAIAQEAAKPFRVGAGFGGAFSGFREETDSSINRYLNTVAFYLDGNIEKGLFLHSFNLGFFMGESRVAKKYEEKYAPPRYYSYKGNFEYALDYRLWGNDTFPGYLGGAFRTDLALVETLEVAKITAIFSLGVHATQKWIINPKNKLTLSVGVPLFAYAVRSPYAGLDELFEKYTSEGTPIKLLSLGKFASVHNYWAVFCDLKYHYQLIELLSLYGGIGFELSRINIPQPRIDALFRLTAGFAFTF